jgi:hypothetical protein
VREADVEEQREAKPNEVSRELEEEELLSEGPQTYAGTIVEEREGGMQRSDEANIDSRCLYQTQVRMQRLDIIYCAKISSSRHIPHGWVKSQPKEYSKT